MCNVSPYQIPLFQDVDNDVIKAFVTRATITMVNDRA